MKGGLFLFVFGISEEKTKEFTLASIDTPLFRSDLLPVFLSPRLSDWGVEKELLIMCGTYFQGGGLAGNIESLFSFFPGFSFIE